jgi:putative phosphoribosyl transferase
VVLGLAPGGVLVAAEVARTLDCELGLVAATPLRAPLRLDRQVGAVTAEGACFIDRNRARELGADPRYLEGEALRRSVEARRLEEAIGGPPRPALAGRAVLVVDDGVDDGHTALAVVRAVRAGGGGPVYFAAPVGPPDVLRRLRREADDVVCLVEDSYFVAVAQFYDEYPPVDLPQIRAALEAAQRRRAHAR